MTAATDLPSDGSDRNGMTQPEPAVHRAIAGVYEKGFREGWGETIPWYPSYRSLRCGEALCVLTPLSARAVWLQVHLFVHAEGHEPPRLTCTDRTSTWAWKLTTGWLTLHHKLSSNADVMEIRFAAEEQADAPWWEFRVNEVSLLDPSDPRLRRL